MNNSDYHAGLQTSRLQQRLEAIWYGGAPGAMWLKPLSVLYQWLAAISKRRNIRKQIPHQLPVIVVGNISVGGTGKTPLVIYLAQALTAAGYQPGIITRGYGGNAKTWPQSVKADSSPSMFGDEPVLMAKRSGVPVVAGPKRNDDIQHLTQHHDVNVVISDDGLQHYQLARDIEIVVIDGARGLGNERCLPAGPLREPPERLSDVDFLVINETESCARYSMQLVAEQITHLNSLQQQPLSSWYGQKVHAVTGIGNPERFFNLLRGFGLNIIPHAFPDHHLFSPQDVSFEDKAPVLMTEKDAVKCQGFGNDELWTVPVTAQLNPRFVDDVLSALQAKKSEKR